MDQEMPIDRLNYIFLEFIGDFKREMLNPLQLASFSDKIEAFKETRGNILTLLPIVVYLDIKGETRFGVVLEYLPGQSPEFNYTVVLLERDLSSGEYSITHRVASYFSIQDVRESFYEILHDASTPECKVDEFSKEELDDLFELLSKEIGVPLKVGRVIVGQRIILYSEDLPLGTMGLFGKTLSHVNVELDGWNNRVGLANPWIGFNSFYSYEFKNLGGHNGTRIATDKGELDVFFNPFIRQWKIEHRGFVV